MSLSKMFTDLTNLETGPSDLLALSDGSGDGDEHDANLSTLLSYMVFPTCEPHDNQVHLISFLTIFSETPTLGLVK